jgi:UDPglucose 6-dehydrogenase
MRIAVYGLWHLGCVTAGCLARAGFDVVGLDPDRGRIADLHRHQPPLHEPGLPELIAQGSKEGRLRFTADAADALRGVSVLWVTFDTPVNDRDEADVDFVGARLEDVAKELPPGVLVLISSQVPVGFTRRLAAAWHGKGLTFAYSPENLRLGKAIDVFCKPERVVLGIETDADRPRLEALFAPFCSRLEWMSLESAEMTKHALNAFLGTSVTFINELARVCEKVGANAKDVERGLKSEGRIGPKAYLSPGGAFAGGTLARDLRFLVERGRNVGVATPLLEGVLTSNDIHKSWVYERVAECLIGVASPVAAVLGLTYKPGTNTLRRSSAVELARWLCDRGVHVRAYDPSITALPPELHSVLELAGGAAAALNGADVAIVATEWPCLRELQITEIKDRMRRPVVIDPNHFLAQQLGRDAAIRYVATGVAGPSEGHSSTAPSRAA